MNALLQFTKILLNLSKVLLIGSLGMIVFLFLAGIFMLASDVRKPIKAKVDISSPDYCKENAELGLCKMHPE